MKPDDKTHILSVTRERLADNAHSSWSNWMAYLFEHSKHNKNGSVTIPKKLVNKWKRQMETSFEDLIPAEKWSDYAEADKIMNLLKACLTNAED